MDRGFSNFDVRPRSMDIDILIFRTSPALVYCIDRSVPLSRWGSSFGYLQPLPTSPFINLAVDIYTPSTQRLSTSCCYFYLFIIYPYAKSYFEFDPWPGLVPFYRRLLYSPPSLHLFCLFLFVPFPLSRCSFLVDAALYEQKNYHKYRVVD